MQTIDNNNFLKERSVFSKKMLQFIYCLFLLSIVVSAVFFNLSAADAATRAGTVIENTARVVYTDQNNKTYQTLSNKVTVIVSAVPGVEISPGTTLVLNSIETFTLAHTVTNTGNAADYINLDLDLNQNWNYNIYLDFNNNNLIDDQDSLLIDNNGDNYFDTGLIEPGDKVHLLIEFFPDQSLLDNKQENVNVTAFSSLNTEIKSEANNEILLNDNVPYIEIKQAPETIYSEQSYKYNIFYENRGENSLTNVRIENILPSQLEYISSDGGGNYIIEGTTKKIVWTVGELLAGESGSFEVTVSADKNNNEIYTVINEAAMYSDQTEVIIDKTATEIVSAAPDKLNINIEPKIIIGDGESTALITVDVYDRFGEKVPDGTKVILDTEAGVFIESGKKSLIGYTKDGTVTAELLSPVLYGDKEINNKVNVTAGDDQNNKVSESIIISFVPGGIAGEVIDEQINQPLSGIKVSLMDKNGDELIDISDNPVFTNEQGRYYFIAPEINEYQLIFELPNKVQIRKNINVTELGGKIFYPTEALAGKVMKSNSGGENVLSNTSINIYDINDISLENPLKTAMTDSEGDFLIQDFNNTSYPAEYIITAEKTINDKLYFDKKILTFTSAGQLKLNKVLNLYSTGNVYDKDTGQRIEGAEVTLIYADGEKVNISNQLNPLLTNQRGEYIIFAEPGSYKLKVTAEGYDEYFTEPFTTNGEPVNRDIALEIDINGGIELSKEIDKEVVRPGEELNYRFKYKNVSRDDFSNIVLHDILPQALIIDDSTLPSGVVYNEDKHSLSYDIDYLAPGESGQWSFSAVVDKNQNEGIIVNRSYIYDQSNNEKYGYDSAVGQVLKKGNIKLNHFAEQSSYKVGDIVDYSVKLKNEKSSEFNYNINDLKISVELPPGFSYLKGSSKINGTLVGDPKISGRRLSWDYPLLKTGEEIIISYKTKIGPEAETALAESRAYLDAKTAMGSSFSEGPAVSIVEVSSHLFTEKSAIFGRVFLDLNNNGIHDQGEKSLENIKLILDDGTIITTDTSGDYSHNLIPGEYTISILPESFSKILNILEKENLNLAEEYRPNTLALLRPGNIKQFDFPISVNKKTEQVNNNLQLKILSPDVVYLREDNKEKYDFNIEIENIADLESGSYDLYLFTSSSFKDETIVLENNYYKDIEYDDKVNIASKFEITEKIDNTGVIYLGAALYKNDNLYSLLKDTVKRIEIRKTQANKNENQIRRIIKPEAESILSRRHLDIMVKGYKSDQIDVYLNSKLIDKNKIGKEVVNNKENIKELEYISVEFEQGENKIKVDYTDKKRNSYSVTENVYLPGKTENIDFLYPELRFDNNQIIELPVYLILTDQNKLPVLNGDIKNLSIEKGDYYYSEDYSLKVNNISENLYRSETNISTNNILNRLMAEGNNIEKSSDIIFPDEEFENNDWSGVVNINTTFDSEPKIKTYLRKKIDEDSLFTFRLDSENIYEDELFNTDDEDYLYNDYGDDSTFINNSSSTTGVFASIRNKNSYYIYGDIYTGFDGQKILSLDNKLNGFKVKGERNNKNYNFFIATEDRKQVSEKIIPEGISGYYFLSNKNIVSGSEIVIIKTSYENRTDVKEEKLFKDIDYTINYKDGTIVLKNPIYRYTEEFGTNIIELKYKIYSPDYEASYFGAKIDLINDDYKNLGISYIDQYSGDNSALGINGSLTFNEDNEFKFEAAWDNNNKRAVRSSLDYDSLDKTEIDLSYEEDEGLNIPGEDNNDQKSSEFNGRISRSIKNNNEIYLNYNKYDDSELEDKEHSIGLLSKDDNDQEDAKIDLTKVLRKEAEENKEALILTGEKKFRLNKDLDLTLMDKYLLNGDEELIESPKSSIKLNYKYSEKVDFKTSWYKSNDSRDESLVKFNLDYHPNDDLTLFTSYNLPLNNMDDSKEENLNYGLNNYYKLNSRTGLEVSAQKNIKFEEESREESLTASTKLNYTREDLEASLKYEFKNGEQNDSRVWNLNVKGDVNQDSRLSLEYNNYDGSYFEENDFDLKYDLEANWAYRPVNNNRLNGFSSIAAEKYLSGSKSQSDYQEKMIRIISTDWIYKYNKRFDFGLRLAYKSTAENISGYNGRIEFKNSIMIPQFNISYKFNENNYLDFYKRYIIADGSSTKDGYSLQYRYRLSEGLNLIAGYNSEDLSINKLDNKSWDKGLYYQLIYSRSF